MEFVSALPAALIPVALVIYYSNKNTIEWMRERKELAEAVLAERKETLQAHKDMLERQFSFQERLATELANTRGENHALRGKLTEFMLRLDNHFFGRTGKNNVS